MGETGLGETHVRERRGDCGVHARDERTFGIATRFHSPEVFARVLNPVMIFLNSSFRRS